jgi:hypothetical protein
MSKPQYELAEVIRDYGEDFSKKHTPLKQHLSVLSAYKNAAPKHWAGMWISVTVALMYASATIAAENRHCLPIAIGISALTVSVG